MRGFNKVVLIGNVVRIDKLRFTKDNRPVTNMIVASNRKVKDKTVKGTFIPVTLWDDDARKCVKYLKKGHPVFIEGRLESGTHVKKGVECKSLEVVAQIITFLDNNIVIDMNDLDEIGE